MHDKLSISTHDKALDSGRGGHMTGKLVLPVTAASLGAALILVIAVSIVTVIKLQTEKANMAKLIKSMAIQRSSGAIVKRDINREYYENIEICDRKAATKTVDIGVNENPAYPTVKDL